MDRRNQRPIHVLVFPWLAQGHISPFLQLSKRLAIHGVKVSFLSTPVNINRIKPLVQPPEYHFPGQIKLVELALPPVEGLPLGAECTTNIADEMAFPLKKALDGIQKPFESLLQQLSPDYVIHDFAQHWAPAIAAKLGIPTVFFLVLSPAASSYILHPARIHNKQITARDLTLPPPDYPSSAISWRPYEACGMVAAFTAAQGETSDIHRGWKCVEGCCAIAIKSCFVTENKYLHFLQKATGKPVVSVGPLLPDLPKQPPVDDKESYFLRWLDKKPVASVVFVSFGSETFLSEEQIYQLGVGLEESQQPFLWVLRFPSSTDSHGDPQMRVRSSLPGGFENRTRDRGIVVSEWVPQPQIVSHRSVGCYLSHGGWSSVMEALMVGLPLILLPIKLDQSLNARFIVDEFMVGLEIERGSDGSFSKDDICGAVRMVMAEEEGTKFRLEAQVARNRIIASNRSQKTYIEEFIHHVECLAPSLSTSRHPPAT